MVIIKKRIFSSRVLHNWLGGVLVLPLFIVGMSTFFMAHGELLGKYIIGYSSQPVELRDLLITPNGKTFLATRDGVYQLSNAEFVPIKSLQNNEVRLLELLDDGRLLAAGKQGLWLNDLNASWIKLYHADIYGIQIFPQSWHIVTKEQGILISDDQGQSWKNESHITQLTSAIDYKKPVKLGRLMKDLHTGRALMGRHYEWIWDDVLALVLVILSLTGIYMWWKTQRRKQKME